MQLDRNLDIEKLKKDEEEAFWLVEEWKDKLEQCELILLSAAKSRSLAYTEYCALEDKRDWEHEAVKASDDNYRRVWDEFEDYRDYMNSHIDLLRLKFETEHALMEECFKKSDFAYDNRDKKEASYHRSEGYEHKRHLLEFHEEICRLEKQIANAKAEAEREAPECELGDYLRAEKAFSAAKIRLQVANEEYEKLVKERDLCKAEYEFACATHERIKKALEKVKNH